jgi:glycosyltransferase involved in cell wall biosynthesis
VRTVPLGVYAPPQRPPRPEDPQLLCAVVSGTGEPDEDYEAFFAAMRELVDDYPHVQFFLDGQRGDQHGLWQMAKRMRLLENVSLVPRRLGHRELLIKADALIQPQATGRARTLTLQAMAAGVPVLAKVDPWIDDLVDGTTAWLASSADAGAWATLLRRVIERPNDAWELGERARQWVAERHQPSAQVRATVDVYRQATGESWNFQQETGQPQTGQQAGQQAGQQEAH